MARFGRFGGWVSVRCPLEHAPLMIHAGGMWDPGERHWCVHPRRIDPVLRELLRLLYDSTERGPNQATMHEPRHHVADLSPTKRRC